MQGNDPDLEAFDTYLCAINLDDTLGLSNTV